MTHSQTVGPNGEQLWPSWFPPGCPPDDAVPAEGDFFRLTEDDEVVEDDFQSHLERHLLGRQRKYWAHDVQAASCSVFGDATDAHQTREAIGSLRHKRVARGTVSGSGAMQSTPSQRAASHHSWWRPVGDRAWQTFAVKA